MHELYLEHYEPQIHAEWCLGNKVKPQVGYDYYRNIFNTSFNLAFGRPRSDTCCTCDELNIAIQAAVSDEEKKRLETKLQLHHRKAERFYEEMKKDTLKSKLDPSFDVVTFDFQQNLPLPYLPVNEIFYLRQLWLYVFSIHVTSVDDAFMYCWDESVSKRGCNEVISCLHHYIQHHLSSFVKTLHIYSDGCAGQNKNRIVMAYLFHLVESGQMEEILHTFPVRGHSFLPNDRDFALTEKKKRSVDTIYHPQGWMQLIQSARRQQPFDVIAVNQEMVLDFKRCMGSRLLTTFKDASKAKVAFQDVKMFHFSKSHKEEVWVKYSMSQSEAWKAFKMTKKGAHLSIPTEPASRTKLPIKASKVAEKYVPGEHRDFYLSLKGTTAVSYDSESDSD